MMQHTLLTGFGHENYGSRLMFETVLHRMPETEPPIIEMPRGDTWHAWYRGYVLAPNALLKHNTDKLCRKVSPRIFSRLGFKLPEDCAQVLDISGYAHDHGNAIQLMRNKLRILQRTRDSGAKIIFLPHSLSIRDDQHRVLFRELYQLADAVYLRDDHSLQLAEDLNCDTELRSCPDFVLWHPRLDSPEKQNPTPVRNTLVIIPNFKAQTEQILATARRALAAHRADIEEVVIISFYAGESVTYLQSLADAIGPGVRTCIEPEPHRVFEVFDRARLCVSARYHGCCLALYARVPLVTVGWSEKYESLLQTWHYPRNTDETEIVEAANSFYRGPYVSIRSENIARVRAMFSDLQKPEFLN